jgi:hypothetical protein
VASYIIVRARLPLIKTSFALALASSRQPCCRALAAKAQSKPKPLPLMSVRVIPTGTKAVKLMLTINKLNNYLLLI